MGDSPSGDRRDAESPGRPRQDADCETQEIYNSIRKWGFLILFSLLILLTLADMCDSLLGLNRYEGPPSWLIGTICGVFAFLFGGQLAQTFRK